MATTPPAATLPSTAESVHEAPSTPVMSSQAAPSASDPPPVDSGEVAPAESLAAAALRPPPVTTFSKIDIIDWKVAESKDGSSFITFLFELVFLYPPLPSALAAAAAAVGADLPPTVNLVVGKRFAELHAFNGLLERHFACLPPFPEKTLTRRTDHAFVDARCRALESWARQLLVREDVQRTGWVQKFFTVPSPAARIREAHALRQEQARNADRISVQTSPASTQPTKRYDSALEDADPTVGTPAVSVEVDNGSADFTHADADAAASQTAEEEDSSEPATTSNSFSVHPTEEEEEHESAPNSTSASYDSDHEFESHLRIEESEVERARRRKEGSRVHDTRRGVISHGLDAFLHASATAAIAPSSAVSAAAGTHALPPSSVALEFLSRSSVFSWLKVVMVDDDTILCAAADQSKITKVDSWISGLFSKKKDKNKDESDM